MSQYRLFAKAVAIVDLVLATLSMLTVIGVVIVAAFAASDKNLQDKIQKEIGYDPNLNAAIWILIAVVATSSLFAAIQMLAAIKLMSATDIGRETVDALRLATTWRNVSVALLILGIVGSLASGLNLWLTVDLLLRGAKIYIVFRYMQELEMMLNPSFPVSVTVQK